MSLRIFLWDPDRRGVSEIDGDSSFGFERYRTELWGTDAVRSLGAELIPRLASGEELFIEHAELNAVEREARSLLAAAGSIAAPLFNSSDRGSGAVVVRDNTGATMHDAWGDRTPADSIERLVKNLLRAIDLARLTGCGICIR